MVWPCPLPLPHVTVHIMWTLMLLETLSAFIVLRFALLCYLIIKDDSYTKISQFLMLFFSYKAVSVPTSSVSSTQSFSKSLATQTSSPTSTESSTMMESSASTKSSTMMENSASTSTENSASMEILVNTKSSAVTSVQTSTKSISYTEELNMESLRSTGSSSTIRSQAVIGNSQTNTITTRTSERPMSLKSPETTSSKRSDYTTLQTTVPPPRIESAASGVGAGTVAGPIIAILLVVVTVAVLIIALVFLLRKRKKRRSENVALSSVDDSCEDLTNMVYSGLPTNNGKGISNKVIILCNTT